MNLYLIEAGTVSQVTADVPDTDGTDSVLALAGSHSSAWHTARRYGRGEIQPGNVQWHGRTVAALTSKEHTA